MKNDKLVSKDKGFIDDAVVVIMNLCHDTIHAEFSYNSTKDKLWLLVVNESRKDRTELLDMVISGKTELFNNTNVIDLKDIETDNSDFWCISKHSLIISCGYTELGVRCLSMGNLKLAEYFYAKSIKYLDLFYSINKLK